MNFPQNIILRKIVSQKNLWKKIPKNLSSQRCMRQFPVSTQCGTFSERDLGGSPGLDQGVWTTGGGPLCPGDAANPVAVFGGGPDGWPGGAAGGGWPCSVLLPTGNPPPFLRWQFQWKEWKWHCLCRIFCVGRGPKMCQYFCIGPDLLSSAPVISRWVEVSPLKRPPPCGFSAKILKSDAFQKSELEKNLK